MEIITTENTFQINLMSKEETKNMEILFQAMMDDFSFDGDKEDHNRGDMVDNILSKLIEHNEK